MPINRFYIDKPLREGDTISLFGTEFHHLQVMRLIVNDTIEFIDGKNNVASARILSISKEEAICSVLQVLSYPPPPQKIILFQAIPKQNRLDAIVEKTVELGVSKIVFFPGDLSEKKNLSPSLLERLQTIAISAMKQCGRFDLPSLIFIPSLTSCSPQGECFFGDTRKKSISFHNYLSSQNKESISLFIGPEKGFSPEEIIFLEKKILAQGISLSSYVLRTDTASIAAVAIATHGMLP
ncbi:MAG: 16S rRNA (uracil(1498)-N(3))-methyltransferase [Parachlamydiales bacterium]|nr:16S rRNA (uracil(1498)-N(3))-methyltransferase [Parachlamydiales bacterium]